MVANNSVGQFTFSACGSSPTSKNFPPDPIPNLDIPAILLPDNTTNSYNVLISNGSEGLTLDAGYAIYGLGAIATSMPTLSATPSPYRLVFPQQFFDIFGLEVPAPYTNQPFFFEDGQRVYFVTEVFSDASNSQADVNTESPDYRRLALTAAPGEVDLGLVFPPAAPKPAASAASPASSRTATAAVAQPLDSTPIAGPTTPPSQIVFSNFFHPHVCPLIKALNRYGLSNLLTLNNQALTNDNGVISGMVLSGSMDRPNMTPGLLIAQGQLYESMTSPDLNLGPVPPDPNPVPVIGPRYLYLYFTFSPGPTFYYNSEQSPNTPGDAYLGKLIVFAPPVVLAPPLGVFPVSGPTVFEATYDPTQSEIFPETFPFEVIDFSLNGAYSIYNWELFFHIPLLVATQLSQNQQFQNAQLWFHYIFNPTISSNDPIPQRYWRFLPFYECSPGDHVEGQIQNLFNPPPSGSPALCGQDISDQLNAWMASPFDPFMIGRMRTIAFRMKVVMAYLDNLIAWGDSLFGQNTRESINEATQIYVLAKDILGPRPVQIPQRGTIQDYTYNDLKTFYGIDDFSNALVQMENDFPYLSASSAAPSSALGTALSMSSVVPYFCFPPNDTLLGYWDTVDDRLYKIRHCMNIQGVVEQLPLFAPPISPALLVAAAAAGVDLSSVLSNTNAATPFYRFSFMVQKTLDLCAEIRSLAHPCLRPWRNKTLRHSRSCVPRRRPACSRRWCR